MEFLYKLYDLPNFGIIIFAIIAILLILFLVILMFGKNDEKKRLEETSKLELANTEAFKEVSDNTKELKIPEIEQPEVKVEEPKKEDIVQTIEQPVVPETKVEMPIPVVEEKNEVDLNNLLENNMPEINNEEVKEPVMFDLPKMAELPKLKEDEVQQPQPIQQNTADEANINSIFENLENETYNLNK